MIDLRSINIRTLLAAVAIIGLLIYLAMLVSQRRHHRTIEKMIRDGALVVDVRTPGEFSAGHYKGAINIPLSDIELKIFLFGQKDKPIVVYCRSGNRSTQAKKILESHGYTAVENGGGLKDMPE